MHHVIEKVTFPTVENRIEQSTFVIIDAKVRSLHFPDLLGPNIIEVKEPESQKSIEGFQKLVYKLLDLKITRSDCLLAIGGGALSDLVGFVAATVLRGVSLEIVPTTLLAMIDAAIGGKNGINTPQGKNLVGTFHFPKKVYICTDFLTTLQSDQYQSGLGELSKYALLSKDIHQIVNQNVLDHVITECARYKENVVAADPMESDKRLILNLGHTLGHALEKIEGIQHGVAVAKGILSILNLYAPQLLPDYQKVLATLSLEVECPRGSFADLEKYVSIDKKRSSKDDVVLVVPKQIGDVEIKTIKLSQLMKDVKENEYFKNFK